MAVGEPADLTARIQWEGPPDAYAILSATTDPLDWARVDVRETAAETSGNTQSITQTVQVTPSKAGNFTFPALRIAYGTKEQLAAAAQTGGAESQPYPALSSEPFQVTVREPVQARSLWLGGGAVAGGLGAAVVVLLARRRRKAVPVESRSPADHAQDLLHQARRQRLDGNLYEYYRALAKAVEAIAGDEQARALATAMHERARRVGYQGVRPPDDDLDGDLREVERALRRFKEAMEQ